MGHHLVAVRNVINGTQGGNYDNAGPKCWGMDLCSACGPFSLTADVKALVLSVAPGTVAPRERRGVRPIFVPNA
jgi:hypothetical protein